MALARWQRTIVNAAGNVQPGASVEVRRESDAGLASLFSDRAGSVGIANPFTAEAVTGMAAFHVADGAYRIDATFGADTVTWRYQGVSLTQEADYAGLVASIAAKLASVDALELVTTNRTYHVDDGGNDTSGDGLTSGTAWATLPKAYNFICDNLYIMPGVTITIQIGNGTLTVAGNSLWAITKGWNGPGHITVNGHATPSNVVLQNTGAGANTIDISSACTLPGTLTIQNVRAVSTQNWLSHEGIGRVVLGGNLEVGTCTAFFASVSHGGSILEVPTQAAVVVNGNGGGLVDIDSGYGLYFAGTTAIGTRTYTDAMFQARYARGRLAIESAFTGSITGRARTTRDGGLILHGSSAGALPTGSVADSMPASGGEYIDRDAPSIRSGNMIFTNLQTGLPTGGMPSDGGINSAGSVKVNNVALT